VTRVFVEQYTSKEIVNVDVSGCNPEDCIQVLNEATRLIKEKPRNSVLILANVQDTHYTKETVLAVKNFAMSNTPYVKGSAVLGIDGAKQAILATVRFLTLHEIKSFDTREEAKDWLVSL